MTAALLSVYKLDTDKIDALRYLRTQQPHSVRLDIPDEIPALTYIAAIIDRHNSDIQNGDSTSSRYQAVALGAVQQIEDTTFYTYHSAIEDREHKWNRLFPETLGLSNPIHENVVSFYTVDEEIFAISSGHSLGLFEQYIDGSFPLEVAQRIMHPEPTSANERIVAGNVYGRAQSFRRQQVISTSRSINSVWQSIGGQLTEEVTSSEAFMQLFPRRTKNTNAEFSGAVLIKKALDFNQLPTYTRWLIAKENEQLSPIKSASFSYLQSLKRVKPRQDKALIRRLNVAFMKYVLNITNNPDYELYLDFSHANYSDFILAQSFRIYANEHFTDLDYEEVYEAHPGKYIITKLHEMIDEDLAALDLDDEGAYDTLKTGVQITASLSNKPPIIGPLLNFFHGEFDFEDRKFFRIDGLWYEASSNFIRIVKEEFSQLIQSSFIAEPRDYSIILNPLGNTKENPYNRLYADRDEYIVTDKVEVRGVEIADVIRFTDQGIEIHHNKIGFGASIRDVRSQLSLSMALIGRILDSKSDGEKILEDYYDMLERKYTSGEYRELSLRFEKSAFIEKFLSTDAKDFTFILGCLDDSPISVRRKSSIAKYELIGLCNVDTRDYNFDVKIIRIGRAQS